MITLEQSKNIVAEFGKEFGSSDKDSGCTAVQVALITTRISNLAPHFAKNKHDYSGNRGLLKLIGQRKRLLSYLSRTDAPKYQALIKKLGLRK
ncbi:MAG: 30S ribosomal protein S15 [Bacteriovorax sp.]|nr:30S ribosomal protein S15 [Bacteriovorax sp.]